MYMKLLVQKSNQLNVSRIVEFIGNLEDIKLILIHSSIKKQNKLDSFFNTFKKKITVPFLGLKVSGSLTNIGYFEDSIVVACLCGNFGIKMLNELIDMDDPQKTVDKISPKIPESQLCMAFSATIFQEGAKVDFILRKIQSKHPYMQICGGASSPPPQIITNMDTVENQLSLIFFERLKPEFRINTGFYFNRKDDEHIITKSDNSNIFEIDNKNAVNQYSQIQHVKPYFINMLVKYVLERSDFPPLLDKLFQANSILRDNGSQIYRDLLGVQQDKCIVEPIFVVEADDKKTQYLKINTYKPTGTIIKHVTITKQRRLSQYKKIIKQTKYAKAVICASCATEQSWIDFDYKRLYEIFKDCSFPFLVSYVFGEFGAKIPYTDKENNIVQGGTIKTLIFK